VIEFDAAGNVVQGWGDPSQDISIYPRNPHGIFVDHENNVWVGTYMHHRVMKFTREGKHLMTIGVYDKTGGSNDTTLLGGPAGIWVDPKTNEVFIADGYRNRRVIVFDGATASTSGTGARTARCPTIRRRTRTIPNHRTSSSRPCTASPARATG
jgi:DNA-binding beta-propeller fold protein YncE